MPGISVPQPLILGGYVAGEDLTGCQYCAVKRSAANTVVKGAADTDLCIGILYNEPYTGEPCEIVPPGQMCMMKVDGAASAITAGMRLVSDAAGVGHVSTTNLKRSLATAWDDSSADGDIIAVAFNPSDISLT